MTREEKIEMLEKEKAYMIAHGGDRQAEALTSAIKALKQDAIAQERYEDLCEYFGNAKDILNSRNDFKAWLDRVKWHIHKAEELYEKYEQESKYCDRNICVSNEYNGIGCDECEVTKSQEPKEGHWIDERTYMECPNCHDIWHYEENQTERFKCCPTCGERNEYESKYTRNRI